MLGPVRGGMQESRSDVALGFRENESLNEFKVVLASDSRHCLFWPMRLLH